MLFENKLTIVKCLAMSSIVPSIFTSTMIEKGSLVGSQVS